MHHRFLPRAFVVLVFFLGPPCLWTVCGLTVSAQVQDSDWPTARFDAQRTAASQLELPATLHLQWVREFPALQPAWPDQQKLQFDVTYDPIVMGKSLFLASSKHDWVMSLNAATGQEQWR